MVYLGSNSTLDLSIFETHSEVWLETVVDGTEVIHPRIQLATVPYAAFASFCGDAVVARTLDDGTDMVTIDNTVNALSFIADDATVRTSGEMVYRGSFNVGASGSITDVNYQAIGPEGLCLTCTTNGAPPVLVGATCRYRFAFQYSDTINGCTSDGANATNWRLSQYNAVDTVRFEWNLPRTWSGAALYRTEFSDYFDQSAIDTCNGNWTDTCRFFAKLHGDCSGHTPSLASIELHVYNQLP